MAGSGPAPKDPNKRARKNSDPTPLRLIQAEAVQQPELPTFDVQVSEDGEIQHAEFRWPERTLAWWRMWGNSPLSADFTDSDWDFLLDTAMLHAKFWNGDMKVAAELRLRVAKFGATPEDRARLRIVFVSADEAEERHKAPTRPSARERRRPAAGA
ncbi:MAG TPA: hypothetical protein VK735_39565 [Pseudonocardia sp.]|uniref:phage terminase small subunit n=1 Tax=Pseudonocardia sp. TaxID=60912 RepID=UPI002BA8F893|nr:hypothetical protein [Pseudonocardia sp.]HTF53581.1 hypothetical protein [Pseudonocardia sp.]